MKLNEVKAGDTVICDDGFACMSAGPHKVHANDKGDLYIKCDEGKHYLAGQVDEDGSDTLVGITKP